MQRFKHGTAGCKYNKGIYLSYISKHPVRRKFYWKYIGHVTYTTVFRTKFSSERTFWNVALEYEYHRKI